ncbi:low affinity immunoglobulin gamma Fc region receptor II-a-like [Archocentrus centrarchus]|uniref:low affinity immunoglobulin gamma Fc region receptor II-a-like n=1 Tax=Archocentrus centrarchus TaxID=63155 RepID=UPI0011E9E2FF|nr:low affinity immunoglobulin gamma Fc region receptor II-a-like [Archocentrus centrarchus]
MIVMILLDGQDQKADAVSLRIVPNRSQFFEYEPVTFYCDGVNYCEVVHEGKVDSCSKTNKTPTGSSCTIKTVYTDDSGEYWSETEGGKRSNIINITVTDGSVILEVPALPVMEGQTVTLHCRNKIASSNLTADFYKDGRHIHRSSTGNMNIYRVFKSDEGLYKCSISGAGESPESWLKVTETQADPSLDHGCSIYFILRIVFTVVMVAVMLLVVVRFLLFLGETVTLHCRNKTSSSNFKADFYKDGRHIHRSSTGNMNIYRVSKSDEGLYKCSISGAGGSPESWLKVTGGITPVGAKAGTTTKMSPADLYQPIAEDPFYSALQSSKRRNAFSSSEEDVDSENEIPPSHPSEFTATRSTPKVYRSGVPRNSQSLRSPSTTPTLRTPGATPTLRTPGATPHFQ